VNDWTQIGVGGLLAVFILREVFKFILEFVSKKKANGQRQELNAGERPVEFWQAEHRKAIGEIVVALIVPILANQTRILDEMRRENAELNQNVAIMLDRLSQQQNRGA